MTRSSFTVSKPSRRGSALILTLLAVLMLSLAAYTFSELMQVEAEAVQGAQRLRQARLAAESGVEAVAAALETADEQQERPARVWQEVPLGGPDDFAFTIGAEPGPSAGRRDAPILHDESAKLNLLALPLAAADRRIARRRLLALPGCDARLADAILDWLDADDEPSEWGAESRWYASQPQPVAPRQGPIAALDELLLVRGMTRGLLYGEDQNRNGRLDPEENDGHRSAPPDNQDGRLDSGWSGLVTLTSWERNLRPDGAPRINLNHSNLVELYDALAPEFGPDAALFVVAWRLNGDADGTPRDKESEPKSAADVEAERARKREEARARAARQQTEGSPAAPAPAAAPGGAETRGGLVLNRRPAYAVRSVWDLIGSKVRVNIQRKDVILKSPWKADPATFETVLPMLEERLSVVSGDRLTGRINVYEAPRAVLLTIPAWTPDVVDRVLRARRELPPGSDRRTLAWLLATKTLDLTQLRAAAPYLTTDGAVFRGVAWGYAPESPVAVGLDFLIDSASQPATLLELTEREPINRHAGRTDAASSRFRKGSGR